VVVSGCLKSRQCFRKFRVPWTTVVFLAASPRRGMKGRLLVKSRSVGGRIENFLTTWLSSQEQGTCAERTGYGDGQKSRYRRVPDALEPRGGRFGTAMLGERRFDGCTFFTFPPYLLFMGHFSSWMFRAPPTSSLLTQEGRP